MSNNETIARIQKGFQWLQAETESPEVLQSIDELISKLNQINSVIAWAYEVMANKKKSLNEAKRQAYLDLNAKSVTMRPLYSPSLAKDYINSVCANEAFEYDLTERLCRACVHVAENLRTSISALKETMKMENYSSNVM